MGQVARGGKGPPVGRRVRPVAGGAKNLAGFFEALEDYRKHPGTMRLLLAVALGSAAFSMQDILLEPYGGEILGMSGAQTTLLTGLWAAGTMSGFAWAAYSLNHGAHMYRVAARGLLIGIASFSAIIFASPVGLDGLFFAGAAGVGLGGGLFAVCTMLAAMGISKRADSGVLVGAWSAVQATAIGVSLLLGGVIKNAINTLAISGVLGPAMTTSATGYLFVYHLEIGLLFVCLAVLGPLTSNRYRQTHEHSTKFGLAEMPG